VRVASMVLSKASITTGKWIHAVVIRVKSTGKKTIYINGVLDNSGTGSTVSLNSNSKIKVGRDWEGMIDDLRIYDRALSAQEISTLYSNTTP